MLIVRSRSDLIETFKIILNYGIRHMMSDKMFFFTSMKLAEEEIKKNFKRRSRLDVSKFVFNFSVTFFDKLNSVTFPR